METSEQFERVASIGAHRAKQFLGKLAKYPFVAFVVEGEEVVVYVKGIDSHRDFIADIVGELTG